MKEATTVKCNSLRVGGRNIFCYMFRPFTNEPSSGCEMKTEIYACLIYYRHK